MNYFSSLDLYIIPGEPAHPGQQRSNVYRESTNELVAWIIVTVKTSGGITRTSITSEFLPREGMRDAQIAAVKWWMQHQFGASL